jgi:6 kDa early secretory antigenic target
MTEQLWNFAGIEAGSADIHSAVATTNELLTQGAQSLASLAAVWGGNGSDSYQAVQAKWDAASNELNDALRNLAQTISEASSTMAQTEAGVASTFGGA